SAQASAKAQNKMVLINFTGSDWCGWCIRLRNEVFSKPAFDAFAQDNLVLVEADFPREKAQTVELRQANAALAEQFQIRGYPTIVLLNSEGKKLGALGYAPGGPQAFISELTRISETKAGPSSPSHVKAKKVDDTPPPPLFNGAPSFPPPKFNDLVLKGISGSK